MNTIELGLVNKFIDVFVGMAKSLERIADALENTGMEEYLKNEKNIEGE